MKLIRKWYYKIYHLLKLLGIFILVFGFKDRVYAEEKIESQAVCSVIDKSLIVTNGKRLNQNGIEIDRSSSGITSYISINNTVLKVRQNIDYSDNLYMCFYDINKNLLNCLSESSLSGEISIPSNAFYARFSILSASNLPKFDLCKNAYTSFLEIYTNKLTYLAEGFTNNPYLMTMIGIIFAWIVLELFLKILNIRGGRR